MCCLPGLKIPKERHQLSCWYNLDQAHPRAALWRPIEIYQSVVWFSKFESISNHDDHHNAFKNLNVSRNNQEWYGLHFLAFLPLALDPLDFWGGSFSLLESSPLPLRFFGGHGASVASTFFGVFGGARSRFFGGAGVPSPAFAFGAGFRIVLDGPDRITGEPTDLFMGEDGMLKYSKGAVLNKRLDM